MPVVLLHGWALAQHTYRGVIEDDRRAGLHGHRPGDAGFRWHAAILPGDAFSMRGYAKWVADLLDALDDRGASGGGGSLVRWWRRHALRPRPCRAGALPGAGQLDRWLVVAQRAHAAQHHRAAAVGLGPALPRRRVADPPGRRACCRWWSRTSLPNLVRNPRAIVRVANLARRADLRAELETLRDSGLPISILWGTRDGIIPRESFEALCVASGVEGTVVEGSHSWLLADPQQFGEVITNDVHVAQAARELERRRRRANARATPGESARRRRRLPSRRRRRVPARRASAPARSPSRRRVMPRASSSAASGTACLRVLPALAELSDREPVGVRLQQARPRSLRAWSIASGWK